MPKKKRKSKIKRKSSKIKKTRTKKRSSKKKIKKRSSKRTYSKKKKSSKKKFSRIKVSKQNENSSSQELIFKTKPDWIKNGLANKAQYTNKYNESIKNNNAFWKKEGKRITWIKPYKKIKDVKYSKEEVRIKWYEDGTLNASANCIDRHLKDKKDKTAII